MVAVEGIACAIAVLTAWSCAAALARGGRRAWLDDEAGPQKLHSIPTPRIGGVAVALGLISGAAVQHAFGDPSGLWLLLACLAPGFVWGLIEDLSKRGAVLVRLALTALSATLAYVLLDARITEVGVPLLDQLLGVHAFSFVFTVVAVTGAAHALNIIDGLNGLAGVTAALGALGLAIVAWIVGDTFVFYAASVLAASVGGFLLVNYPRGRIFLGDGGAYLAGLALAELSILLVQHDARVSPWFPVVLLAYPICETMFSIHRRRKRGCSPTQPDALHLHTLVYRRVVRCSAADSVLRNSLASLALWALPLGCWIVAVKFWDQTTALQAGAAGFVLAYLWIYRAIVHFRIPAWLLIRGPEAAAAQVARPAMRGR